MIPATIVLLAVFMLLTIVGIGESSKVAVGIFITVLGFNLLGDGLRDALDPRLNR